jgi:hypothetical protein
LATSRSVGVLNWPVRAGSSNAALPAAPTSGFSAAMPMPTLWKPRFVNSGGRWQIAQPALPTNSSMPALAASLSASCWPAWKRS